jgi:hypothetical protein
LEVRDRLLPLEVVEGLSPVVHGLVDGRNAAKKSA